MSTANISAHVSKEPIGAVVPLGSKRLAHHLHIARPLRADLDYAESPKAAVPKSHDIRVT